MTLCGTTQGELHAGLPRPQRPFPQRLFQLEFLAWAAADLIYRRDLWGRKTQKDPLCSEDKFALEFIAWLKCTFRARGDRDSSAYRLQRTQVLQKTFQYSWTTFTFTFLSLFIMLFICIKDKFGNPCYNFSAVKRWQRNTFSDTICLTTTTPTKSSIYHLSVERPSVCFSIQHHLERML